MGREIGMPAGGFGRDGNRRQLEEDDVASWAERGGEELDRGGPRERGKEGGPA